MKLYRVYHLRSHSGINSLDKSPAVKRQLIFQCRTRHIHMHHSVIHISAHRVSVDTGSHDLAPQIRSTMLPLRILKSSLFKSLGHYLAHQFRMCLLHSMAVVCVNLPSHTSHRR